MSAKHFPHLFEEGQIGNFETKIKNYKEARDFFFKNGTSNLAVHLRFGLISPRELFNKIKNLMDKEKDSTTISQ